MLEPQQHPRIERVCVGQLLWVETALNLFQISRVNHGEGSVCERVHMGVCISVQGWKKKSRN